jgi:hypothetical protein
MERQGGKLTVPVSIVSQMTAHSIQLVGRLLFMWRVEGVIEALRWQELSQLEAV